MSIHIIVSILQHCALFLTILVQAQDEIGFISIDCGASESSYKYEPMGITYLSDARFTESGESHDILSEYKSEAEDRQLWNLRSFPEGTRNCYTLEPKTKLGPKYLIRARFMYGNYDNKDQTPAFDLHIGVDFWDRVEIPSANASVHKEIMFAPLSERVHVCLVNTGLGTPFISALELRPIEKEAYTSPKGTSLLLYDRYDFGSEANQPMRYKFDSYDRFWSSYITKDWTVLNSSSLQQNSFTYNNFLLPLSVMRTAFTLSTVNNMGIYWVRLNTTTQYFFFMHFLELQELESNQTREFNIYANGVSWYDRVVPENTTFTIYPGSKGTLPSDDGKITFWFNSTRNATLPPLINALEIYRLQENSGQETYPSDANAILEIKSEYELKIQNWQGDPCVPKDYLWDGLSCSYIGFDPPRITSLNLSSRGLKGQISSHIENLMKLEYLDLSNNSLTGTVPEFLALLKELKVLNLRGNNLEGPLPQELDQRSKFDLSLSVDDNVRGNRTALSPTSPPSSSTRFSQTKYGFVVPIVVSFSQFLLHRAP